MANMSGLQLVWELLDNIEPKKPRKFDGQYRFNSFFPPYPSQAFNRFCEHAATGQRKPNTVYLAVTSACPCKCGHCSYGGRATVQLPTQEMLGIIRQIKDLGCCTLGLTGGEPMVRQDLEELIAAAGPEMATVVFTTGWTVDDRRAAALKEAGLTWLTVSLESLTPDEHDQVRQRKGAYETALKAMRAGVQAGLFVAMSTMATRQRLLNGDLERLYQFCKDEGLGEFRLNPPVATGTMAGQENVMLSDTEMDQLMGFIDDHNRLSDGPVVMSFAQLESAKYFGCGAAYHHLFIDAAGNVCPCDLAPMSFGNLRETPLEQIWEKMGSIFDRPRSKCIMMAGFAKHFRPGMELPLPPEVSWSINPPSAPEEPLPRLYQQLEQIKARGVSSDQT